MFDATSGFLWSLPLVVLVLVFLAGTVTLGFLKSPGWGWAIALVVFLHGLGAPGWLLWTVVVPVAVLLLPPLRQWIVSRPILGFLRAMKFLPAISETEQVAIESGDVWVDGDLFSGKPDQDRLRNVPDGTLGPAEQAFLDGPVHEICESVVDWQVFQDKDLPERTWQLLRKHRLFGLGIPEEYGGHGFSAALHSAVVARLSTRSTPLAITVMVPNSLGPAELLAHYGTEEQKRHYLPRLANGTEIPCFALTEPGAGSDAGAITAEGVVFKDEDGTLKLRLSWEKRYITLAAISTLLGLAFKLRDPDRLLGGEEELGITCALIPTDTPGVVLGRRHDPMGIPFHNCPTSGEDVVVSVDQIIGGPAGAGQGWRMLMECLAAGRGISLPAVSAAGTQMCARVAGAYAAVRRQFGLPIGKFEGIHEPLARIGGFSYLLEAARRYTCAGLDQGSKPPVVTAIAKYSFTELFRKAINDAMDVVGGAGISRGPNNLLAHSYLASPINITVEGANILTRTLMIFGQGAIRCHPHAFAEIQALGSGDAKGFDRALWSHVGHVVHVGCRSLVLSLTRGRLGRSASAGPTAEYWRKLDWASASFAFWSDAAMATLGGSLKRRETLTGRFSDVFCWMYLATATLHRFEKEGCRSEDRPLMHWSMQYAFARMQEAFDGLYRNFEVPVLGTLLRGPVALWSRMNSIGHEPSDVLGRQVASLLQQPGPQRDRLSPMVHLSRQTEVGLGRLESAFALCAEAEAPLAKIKTAIRKKQLPRKAPGALLEEAVEKNVLSAEEAERVRDAEKARDAAIQVDSYTLEEYGGLGTPRSKENGRTGDSRQMV